MRLSQGEYRDSLQLLFPVAETYWGDVIYIAERVLTVDELEAFVDGLPPPSRTSGPADRSDPVANLRALLARRLVRVGRTSEAVAYFPPRVRVRQRKNVMRTAPMSRMPATTSPPSKPFGRDGFEWPWQTSLPRRSHVQTRPDDACAGHGADGNGGPTRRDSDVRRFPLRHRPDQSKRRGHVAEPAAWTGRGEPFCRQRPQARYPVPLSPDRRRSGACRRRSAAATIAGLCRYPLLGGTLRHRQSATRPRPRRSISAMCRPAHTSLGRRPSVAHARRPISRRRRLSGSGASWAGLRRWPALLGGTAARLSPCVVVLCVLFVVWRRRNLRGAGVA